MTVIAWDGKTLAADTRVTRGDLAFYTGIKIFRIGSNRLFGYSGNACAGLMLRDWIEAGCKKEDYPECQKTEDWCNGLLITKNEDGTIKVETYERNAIPIDYGITNIFAIGGGDEIAMAVMGVGGTAEEAVEQAIKHSAYCGGHVKSLSFDETPPSEEEKQEPFKVETKSQPYTPSDLPRFGTMLHIKEPRNKYELLKDMGLRIIGDLPDPRCQIMLTHDAKGYSVWESSNPYDFYYSGEIFRKSANSPDDICLSTVFILTSALNINWNTLKSS